MKSIKKWFKNNKETFKFVSIAFVIWQIALMLIIFLANKYAPTSNQYLYTEKNLLSPVWLWNRANFDGMHYLSIAKNGYSLYQQAFFPLYPKLIHWLTPIFGSQGLVAGWTINLLSFYLALFFLYKLLAMDFSLRIVKRAIVYLLLFPTAFFFSMVYTEALFFLLIVLTFYMAKTHRWWLAGIFGALASATRLPGIFLLAALAVEWWCQYQDKKKKIEKKKMINLLPSILLVSLGLLFYMRYLFVNYGDSLLFAHVQAYFAAGRETSRIILLYQVFWRYFKMLITVDRGTLTYFVVVMEFLTAVSFSGIVIATYFKRWYSYFIFSFLAFLAPTLTGTFLSLPRFVLVLFPAFILLSIWADKHRWLRIIYPLLTIPLLIFCLVLFTRGYWIS